MCRVISQCATTCTATMVYSSCTKSRAISMACTLYYSVFCWSWNSLQYILWVLQDEHVFLCDLFALLAASNWHMFPVLWLYCTSVVTTRELANASYAWMTMDSCWWYHMPKMISARTAQPNRHDGICLRCKAHIPSCTWLGTKTHAL